MKSISSTIEQKNMHMRHVEDKVLYGGVNGTRQAIFALRDMRDLLSGVKDCLLYTSPSPRDRQKSRMPSSA